MGEREERYGGRGHFIEAEATGTEGYGAKCEGLIFFLRVVLRALLKHSILVKTLKKQILLLVLIISS
jgi:hypothetical protein